MPGKSGIEAVHMIKAFDPQARIVMISSVEQRNLIYEIVYKYVTEHTLPYLAGCLQGLLHIYNAKYVIVLEKVSVSQDAALQPFIDFVRIVLSRRGTIAVVAEENNQYIVLKSKLNTEVYKSVKEISRY